MAYLPCYVDSKHMSKKTVFFSFNLKEFLKLSTLIITNTTSTDLPLESQEFDTTSYSGNVISVTCNKVCPT